MTERVTADEAREAAQCCTEDDAGDESRRKLLAFIDQAVRDAELLAGYEQNEPPIVKGALDAQANAERRLFAVTAERVTRAYCHDGAITGRMGTAQQAFPRRPRLPSCPAE